MRKVMNLGLNTKSVRGVHPAYSAYSLYKARVEADGGYIQNELKTRLDFATPGGGTRRYVGYAGIKTSVFEGRVVVDKVYDLHGVADQEFAGLDRPEYLTWLLSTASWGVEKDSENKFLYTRAFDNAYWTDGRAATVTPNTDIAPDGTLTADTITDNSDTVSQDISNNAVGGSSVSPSTEICTYYNIKKTVGATSFPQFRFIISGTDPSLDYRGVFNTDTGASVTNTASIKVSFVDKGDYWSVEFKFTTADHDTVTTIIYPAARTDLASSSTVASVTGSIVLWQADMIESAYPLAPIFAEGTLVTRTATAPVLDGILNDAGWIGGVVDVIELSGEWTWIYENTSTGGDGRSLMAININTAKQIDIRINASSVISLTNIPLLNGFGNRSLFGYEVYWDGTNYVICLFDTAGNIYKYTGAYTPSGTQIADLTIGGKQDGTGQTSLYQSAIASGEEAYSDEFAVKVIEKMVKGDSRFDGAVWEFQP